MDAPSACEPKRRQHARHAATIMSIASASKWVDTAPRSCKCGGSAANLSSSDIDFLHFTSGYTNMGNYTPGVQSCPQTGTVNQCLAQNASYTTQNPQTTGVFDYDSGHMEVHASQNGLGNDGVRLLQSAIQQQIGTDINIAYSQQAPAGRRHLYNGQRLRPDAAQDTRQTVVHA